MAKKKDFPNNWQEFKDADEDCFIPHTFEEVMEWKVGGWELPSSVACIIRVHDYDSGKITEHVYSKRSAAQNKVRSLINSNCEFSVVDHQAIHHVYPQDSDV